MARTTAATAFGAQFPKFDATKREMLATCTQDVSDRALPRTACACLVAEAMKEQPGVRNAWVTPAVSWALMTVQAAKRYVDKSLLRNLKGLVQVRFLNSSSLRNSGAIKVLDKSGAKPHVGTVFQLDPVPPSGRLGVPRPSSENGSVPQRAATTRPAERMYR